MKFTKTIVNAMMTWVNKRFKENTPDWNQSDPNADGYIRNRTHYTYDGETVLLPTTSLVESDQGGLGFANFDGSALEIKAGKEYRVTFDNTVYSCMGYTDPSVTGCVCLGNFTIVESMAGTSGHTDTGEPFVFMHMAAYGVACVYTPTVDSHTIKITTISEKVKKIDQKYLPDLPDMDYVSYEKWQNLTEDQMTLARENIGAGTSNFSGDYRDLTYQPDIPRYVVKYNENQSLTNDDKSRARNNIGAISRDEALSVTVQQNLTDRQKELARANIGASDFDGSFESLTDAPNVMTLDTEQNVPNRKVLNFGQDQSVDGTMTGLEINTCMWKDTDGEMNYHTLLGNGAIKMSRTYADGTSQEMMLSPGIIATGMDTIQFQRHHALSGQSVRIVNLLDPVDYNDAATKGYVDEAIATLVGTAPESLDTIHELAAAFEENADVVDVLTQAIENKADKEHNHDDIYDVKGAASDALIDAKSYTDTKTFNLASTTIVDNKISTHDTSSSAHNDIRLLITELTTKLNNFLDVDDTTTDQLSEVLTLINNNKGTLESLTSSKLNVSDIVNNLTTSSTSKVLSAAQGVAIKGLIDTLQSELDGHTHAIADVSGLQSALDGKAASSHGTHVSYSSTAPVMDGTASVGSASTVARSDHKHPTDTSRASKSEFESHTADSTAHITSTERTNWNAANTHANSAHAPSDAQKNQNAFSNIAVSGQTTVAADSATDTVTFVGSNVSITTDATNDKVTFSVANGTTSAKGVVQLTNSTSSTSTTTAATPSSVKSAYDLANTAKAAAEAAQATADGKANASHGNHVPTTQTANNATFLRNDNTWQKVTPANIGAATASEVSSLSQKIDDLGTVAIEDIVPISKGGTGSSSGATGLKNLFAAGQTVLSSNQYGSTLPSSASEGTVFFKKSTGTVADMDTNLVSELMLTMYPVGSIYMSVNSTSPASLFGGTWSQLKDRFLLGAGSSYSNGATGGAATHTLIIDEMPPHRHSFQDGSHTFLWGDGVGTVNINGTQAVAAAASGNSLYTIQGTWTLTNATGGGWAHNNMPPYLVVYMWKRTA